MKMFDPNSRPQAIFYDILGRFMRAQQPKSPNFDGPGIAGDGTVALPASGGFGGSNACSAQVIIGSEPSRTRFPRRIGE